MTAAGRLLEPNPQQDPRRLAIQQASAASETETVEALLDAADFGKAARGRIAAHAARLVEQIRADKTSHGGLDAFIQEYDLSNQEGIVLMCLAEAPLPDECRHDIFFAPHAYAIDSLDQLQGEVFGPVLHVISYGAHRLDEVLDSINAIGYGLTLGIHSRIDGAVPHIHKRLRVGNTYVNRNMIGAFVSVQPFGGEGLSEPGPKAGDRITVPLRQRAHAYDQYRRHWRQCRVAVASGRRGHRKLIRPGSPCRQPHAFEGPLALSP
jgi:delta 1-pyrroline-5-carboxylate dehydrogenase